MGLGEDRRLEEAWREKEDGAGDDRWDRVNGEEMGPNWRVKWLGHWSRSGETRPGVSET